MGIREIFGTWPGDETDEEIDEALYGEKRRDEREREAVERVIEAARMVELNFAHETELGRALAALDAARSKEKP